MSAESGEHIDIRFTGTALESLRRDAEAFGISEVDAVVHGLSLFRQAMLPLQEEGTKVSVEISRSASTDPAPRTAVGRFLNSVINPPEVERYSVKRPGPTAQPEPPVGSPKLTLIVNHDYEG